MLLNTYHWNMQTFKHMNTKVEFQKRQIINSYTFQALYNFHLFSQTYSQDLSLVHQDKVVVLNHGCILYSPGELSEYTEDLW